MFPFNTYLQINQTSTTLLLLTLLLPRPSTERVVVLLLLLLLTAKASHRSSLSRELRRRHAGVLALQRLLLVEEGVVARLGRFQATHRARAGRVDERSGRRVLGGETHVAGVAEGVLAFAAGQEGVEARLVRVLRGLLL